MRACASLHIYPCAANKTRDKVTRDVATASIPETLNLNRETQDYIDMWENLRSLNPKNDIINRPGQTEGCWVWRCHQRMEKLLQVACSLPIACPTPPLSHRVLTPSPLATT